MAECSDDPVGYLLGRVVSGADAGDPDDGPWGIGANGFHWWFAAVMAGYRIRGVLKTEATDVLVVVVYVECCIGKDKGWRARRESDGIG